MLYFVFIFILHIKNLFTGCVQLPVNKLYKALVSPEEAAWSLKTCLRWLESAFVGVEDQKSVNETNLVVLS